MSPFAFDNSFFRDLEGCYDACLPEGAGAPRLLLFNHELAGALGISRDALTDEDWAQVLSGNRIPDGANPLAQVYSGHQFGHFSAQLGDGRAHLLGEHITPDGARFDIALKGSGRTVFSRRGDGRLAIKPALREYLLGEAMAALGIPTSRALAVVASGDSVMREQPLDGAVLTRVASSHLRVGSLQFFAARQEVDILRKLADYAIARHYPEQENSGKNTSGQGEPYLTFLRNVARATARLIAQWMGVGFIHGVMNTDNVALSGETIDFGPCAFMDAFDPRRVFSSIDHQGRYAYGNQPIVGQWNMARAGEALLPLIDADMERAVAPVQEVVGEFSGLVAAEQQAVFARKLGLVGAVAGDDALVSGFMEILFTGGLDFTRGFVSVGEGFKTHEFESLDGEALAMFNSWHARYKARIDSQKGGAVAAQALATQTNPIYIPRNHLVESALTAAANGDYQPFHTLREVLAKPYTRQRGFEHFENPPDVIDETYQTFCGT